MRNWHRLLFFVTYVRHFEDIELNRAARTTFSGSSVGVKRSSRWLGASVVQWEVFANQRPMRGRSVFGSREPPLDECHRRGEVVAKPIRAPEIGQAGGSMWGASAPHAASANRAPAAAIGTRGRRMPAQQCRRRGFWSLKRRWPSRSQSHSDSWADAWDGESRPALHRTRVSLSGPRSRDHPVGRVQRGDHRQRRWCRHWARRSCRLA